MGMVPREDYRRLADQYERLKEKVAEQEETIRRLRKAAGWENAAQDQIFKGMRELMTRQAEQFQVLKQSCASGFEAGRPRKEKPAGRAKEKPEGGRRMTEKNRDRQGKGDAAVESWNRATLDFWEASANVWFGAMKNPAGRRRSPARRGGAAEDRKDPAPEEDLRGAFDRILEGLLSGPPGGRRRSRPGPVGIPHGRDRQALRTPVEPDGCFSETAAGRERRGWKGFRIHGRHIAVWLGAYEEELRKYLNMPQLGLTRYYRSASTDDRPVPGLPGPSHGFRRLCTGPWRTRSASWRRRCVRRGRRGRRS